MPSPVGLVVKNGWNSLSLMSAGMPAPLSRTRISTCSPASRVVTLSVGSKSGIRAVTRPLRRRVEPVAEDVQQHPGHVLRVHLDRRDALAEIAFQRDVETLILRARTVVGEVQRLIDHRVQIDHAPFGGGPRECSSIAFTMPSARLPCSVIFSRLLFSMAERSSISAR